ncbi:O-antigen ligase family protein [Algibacter sp. 2305UL17-15]|uniref:O-antigen ligase family protein n=1 Tax=Algibacter sp. 2305UL17-15 TaxID=3231268 RepID=UPI003458D9D2
MHILKSKYLRLVIIHLVLGFIIYSVKSLSVVYFLGIVGVSVILILKAPTKNKTIVVLMTCAYTVGAEVFLRMTGGNIGYESSKYAVVLFIVLGIFLSGKVDKRAYTYIIFLFLLVPSIIVASSTLDLGTNVRKAVTFNLSGPFCLGISALYCYNRSLRFQDMKKLILAFLLPILSTVVYLSLYTPSLKEVLTGTGSNFATSGGFGPNQVSTMLGFGIFMLVVKFFLDSKTLFFKLFHLCLIAFMTYRALITFSRGGVFVAGIMIVAFVGTYYVYTSKQFRIKIISLMSIFGLVLVFTWMFSSFNTFGLLDKRYANEDAIGREKEDVTTGRKDLLESELKVFFENPFLGVGVGKMKEIRLEQDGIESASHNEVSRMLAEHGVIGVLALLVLIITPLVFRIKNRKNIFFYAFYLFWILTINHSAMRIAAPAFIYALCLLNLTFEPSKRKRSVKLAQAN